ncbi:MAG: DUF3459 domain-containing protein, partial [Pseudonocardiaceae bacterium]|nr:DUF3459 domain-containing protein [Pseudonocardiaceae bacterium]
LRVAAALVLTAPFTPMLFMGEEWGASTPWQYFADHGDERLAEQVRAGRRSEFAGFGWRPENVPDPQDPATVARSTLDWSEPAREPHHGLLAWHRELIALRRSVPELASGRLEAVEVTCSAEDRWLAVGRGRVAVVANLAAHPQQVPVHGPAARILLASEDGCAPGDRQVQLPAESVAIVRVR